MFAVTQFVLVMRYKAECCRLLFPWGQFGHRVDSALSFMSISGIQWGVMRTELGAKNITTNDFLGFQQSRKVRTVCKFVTKITLGVRLFFSFCVQTSSLITKN